MRNLIFILIIAVAVGFLVNMKNGKNPFKPFYTNAASTKQEPPKARDCCENHGGMDSCIDSRTMCKDGTLTACKCNIKVIYSKEQHKKKK